MKKYPDTKYQALQKTQNINSQEFNVINKKMDDTGENSQLAFEAHQLNMKLLKKQKARFLRLQNIFSQNSVLMPLCVLFSFLSSVLIFAGTLTNHYEYITYDINRLEKDIFLQNNLTLLKIVNNHLINNEISKSSSQHNNESVLLNNKTLNFDRQIEARLVDLKNDAFLFEIHRDLSEKFAIVTRHNYFALDNTTLKINRVYDFFSGIWKRCNYLTSKDFYF